MILTASCHVLNSFFISLIQQIDLSPAAVCSAQECINFPPAILYSYFQFQRALKQWVNRAKKQWVSRKTAVWNRSRLLAFSPAGSVFTRRVMDVWPSRRRRVGKSDVQSLDKSSSRASSGPILLAC